MRVSDLIGDPAQRAGSAEAESDALFAQHLAERAANGDLAATQALLRYVTPTLKRVAVGVLGSGNSDVDDVVQQSLIAVQRALGAFRGECHIAGYSSRIALRVALRARRRNKLELFRLEVLARLSHEPEQGEPPSKEAEAERRRQVLRSLLEELPEEQAEVLALRTILGWSLEEVAQATGAPLNTVRSRVRLAKEALKRRIESTPELAFLKVPT